MLRSAQSPFPGMNPYFESTRFWRGFHNNFASEILAQLVPQLGGQYAAQLEVDSVMETVSISDLSYIRPDVAIVDSPIPSEQPPTPIPVTISPPTKRHKVLVKSPEKLRRIYVKLANTDELVTVIEILSPTNKRSQGLTEYRQKRHTILLSDIHLVEIDLLRAGKRPGAEVTSEQPFDYAAVVNRAGMERISEIWCNALNEPLPTIPVPLRHPDSDVILNLNQIVQSVYTRYGFSNLIDYNQPIPKPKIRPGIVNWWQERKGTLAR